MDEQPTNTDSVEQRLELALRLLEQRHGAGGAVRLDPGRLPADFPLTLPLPDGARLVGSMTQRFSGSATGGDALPMTTIIVDAPLTAEQTVQFYTERLTADGWEQEVMPHMRGGFVHMSAGGAGFRRFNSPMTDYALTFAASQSENEQHTQLTITALRETQAANARRRRDDIRDTSRLIPALIPPPGASQQSGGGGGGGDLWHQYATVETSLNPADLIAHYDKQLERAGWRRHSGGASGPAGWSFWKFDADGELWSGILLALNTPERPRDYFMVARIAADNQSGQQNGGFSFGTLRGH